MALDWSQLWILPARQSYIRQYSKMASISITDIATSETHGQSEAVFLLQISGKTGWWWHSYEQVCVQWWGDVPSEWSETDGFFLWGFVKTSTSPRYRQHYTSSRHGSERPVCKHWSGNSPQVMAGGWISVWYCLSHSWCSHWNLSMINHSS
jgi:hypothetical protein